jgi:hypothetical protein
LDSAIIWLCRASVRDWGRLLSRNRLCSQQIGARSAGDVFGYLMTAYPWISIFSLLLVGISGASYLAVDHNAPMLFGGFSLKICGHSDQRRRRDLHRLTGHYSGTSLNSYVVLSPPVAELYGSQHARDLLCAPWLAPKSSFSAAPSLQASASCASWCIANTRWWCMQMNPSKIPQNLAASQTPRGVCPCPGQSALLLRSYMLTLDSPLRQIIKGEMEDQDTLSGAMARCNADHLRPRTGHQQGPRH